MIDVKVGPDTSCDEGVVAYAKLNNGIFNNCIIAYPQKDFEDEQEALIILKSKMIQLRDDLTVAIGNINI